MIWIETDKYICGRSKDFEYYEKLAGFDLDDTIIKTKSGKDFAENSDDWEFFDKTIPKKLKELYKKKFMIIIFSNQKGIKLKKTDPNEWKCKIENIEKDIGVPIKIYASIGDDIYRKPSPKFFWILKDEVQLNKINFNNKESFYCGDAAGRKVSKNIKDFSDSDYKFALNCGLHFITPEEYFKGEEKIKYNINYPIDFNKLSYGQWTYNFVPIKLPQKEMIIMVGFPGSGKSKFVEKYLLPHKYIRINRDTLKTKAKCVKTCEEHMRNGFNIVIDNTNPDKTSRLLYIDLAKKYKYIIRCINIDTSMKLSMHNASYRSLMSNGTIPHIPKISYNVFNKKYQKPSKDEGFDIIENINLPIDFLTTSDLSCYKLYLIKD